MKVIIVGDGKVGDILANYISSEGHDVTVIDKNSTRMEAIVSKYDVQGYIGNGASYKVLLESDTGKADLFIAVTGNDETNMLCCMFAKKIGAKHTVARVRNPEYSSQFGFMRNQLGVDVIINSDYEAARSIGRLIQFPDALDIDTFGKGRVDIAEIKITQNHPLIGMQLMDFHSTKTNILVCAVRRGGDVIIPGGDYVIEQGDIISITASHSDLISFFRQIGIIKKKIKTVFIIGGSRLAYYLAKSLANNGVIVKIFERDSERCEHLADLLPKATIINADGVDNNNLLDEGLEDADACVSLTGMDELNIVVSCFANSLGVDKVITKVNRFSFRQMLSEMGLESVISPKNETANVILRYLRGIENASGNNIKALYKIAGDMVEAIEFVATEGFPCLGIPLKEIELKSGMLIASIIRKGKVIIPDGETTIEYGDSVIVVTTSHAIIELKDILSY